MMILFDEQCIESVLSLCIVAWYGILSLTNKIGWVALWRWQGKWFVKIRLVLMNFFNNYVFKKAQVILCTDDHLLQSEF